MMHPVWLESFIAFNVLSLLIFAGCWEYYADLYELLATKGKNHADQ